MAAFFLLGALGAVFYIAEMRTTDEPLGAGAAPHGEEALAAIAMSVPQAASGEEARAPEAERALVEDPGSEEQAPETALAATSLKAPPRGRQEAPASDASAASVAAAESEGERRSAIQPISVNVRTYPNAMVLVDGQQIGPESQINLDTRDHRFRLMPGEYELRFRTSLDGEISSLRQSLVVPEGYASELVLDVFLPGSATVSFRNVPLTDWYDVRIESETEGFAPRETTAPAIVDVPAGEVLLRFSRDDDEDGRPEWEAERRCRFVRGQSYVVEASPQRQEAGCGRQVPAL